MLRVFLRVILGLIGAFGGASLAFSDEIVVGFGQDKAPFVTADCSDGIEVRLAHEIFARAGFEVTPRCLTNKNLIRAYSMGVIDAGVSVPNDAPGMFYTDEFSGFENFAVTHSSENLSISSISDLADKSTIAWNNAAAVLGEEFAAVMAGNPGYEEADGQMAQVEAFLLGRKEVIVIDKNIFRWLTQQILGLGGIGEPDTEFTYHPIFPGVLGYYIGFSDVALRDRANAALAEMRADGSYQRIVDEYLKF